MSPVMPVNKVSYGYSAPSFKGAGRNIFNKQKITGDEREKKKLPWRKIGLGVLIGAAAIEFVLRRNPTRRLNQKYYKSVFSKKPEGVARDFAMIPLRDEIIIKEAASGNRQAEKLFGTITPDAPKISLYIRTQEKIQHTKDHFIRGSFDSFQEHKNITAEATREKILTNLQNLQNKANELYATYLKPKVKY